MPGPLGVVLVVLIRVNLYTEIMLRLMAYWWLLIFWILRNTINYLAHLQRIGNVIKYFHSRRLSILPTDSVYCMSRLSKASIPQETRPEKYPPFSSQDILNSKMFWFDRWRKKKGRRFSGEFACCFYAYLHVHLLIKWKIESFVLQSLK